MKTRASAYKLIAQSRGASPEDAMQAVVEDYGDGWILVDTDHPAYPRVPSSTATLDSPLHGTAVSEAGARPPSGGPGTELKAILSTLGIRATSTCSCNSKAAQMDAWGPDGCERNFETIIGWLESQANARGLPFVRFAAEQAVKMAIRRARKSAAS